MNNAIQQQPKTTTATDGLFGMILAQSFMGFAYGAEVHEAFENADMIDDIYTDRFQAKAGPRKPGQPTFELGVKHSLTNVFAGIGRTVAEAERAVFKPSFPSFAAPALA